MHADEDVERELRTIRDDVINLKGSPLYEYRTKNNYVPVIGQGSHSAKIMFVGEAPGKNEAVTGRPFVGVAGKFLDELLAHIGCNRDDVYITNIVKDRPPENRDPTPEEKKLYAPFLDRQIAAIKPSVIVALGRHSMGYLLAHFDIPVPSITEAHGTPFEAHASYGTLTILPLFHPAAAIYDRTKRDVLFKDFEILKEYM